MKKPFVKNDFPGRNRLGKLGIQTVEQLPVFRKDSLSDLLGGKNRNSLAGGLYHIVPLGGKLRDVKPFAGRNRKIDLALDIASPCGHLKDVTRC